MTLAWLVYMFILTATLVWGRPSLAEASIEACEGLHQSYAVVGVDGGSYATWHPASAALPDGTVCHFGHEHGSDPARFAGAAEARPVAFGWVDRLAGREEPHVGFKVFVVEDDGHGQAYRIVLHQGTGHGRRALIRHHEVQFAVADARTGTLLAETAALADFGHGRANCLPHTPLQAVQADASRVGQGHGNHRQMAAPNRTVPTVACAAETPYETWRMAYAIGSSGAGGQAAFSSGLTFEVDDPISVYDPGDPERLVYLCAARPSRQCDDPSGTQTAWKGTRRGLVAPMLTLSNAGPERFTTDAFGTTGDLVPQFVSSTLRADYSGECCGPGVVFKERDGVYVRQSGDGPTFSAGADDATVRTDGAGLRRSAVARNQAEPPGSATDFVGASCRARAARSCPSAMILIEPSSPSTPNDRHRAYSRPFRSSSVRTTLRASRSVSKVLTIFPDSTSQRSYVMG